MYFEPKFQLSTRINQKILPFDLIDDKFINECIINSPLIFEENEFSTIPQEEISTNSLLVPCISDDAFIDKNTLVEAIPGKDFNEIYKSFVLFHEEMLEGEKEELKKKILIRIIQRKHLLKVYMNKFKIQENIRVLKENKQPEDRINQNKFLAKKLRKKRK